MNLGDLTCYPMDGDNENHVTQSVKHGEDEFRVTLPEPSQVFEVTAT